MLNKISSILDYYNYTLLFPNPQLKLSAYWYIQNRNEINRKLQNTFDSNALGIYKHNTFIDKIRISINSYHKINSKYLDSLFSKYEIARDVTVKNKRLINHRTIEIQNNKYNLSFENYSFQKNNWFFQGTSIVLGQPDSILINFIESNFKNQYSISLIEFTVDLF